MENDNNTIRWLFSRTPALQAALAQCLQLSHEERCLLVSELGVSIRLEAWCDGYAGPESEIKGSSPPPPVPSSPAAAFWPANQGQLKANSVVGCPWCRRPVAVLGDRTVPEDLANDRAVIPKQLSKNAYVALLYGRKCHEYFLGALVLGHGLVQYARENRESGSGSTAAALVLLHTPDVPSIYLRGLSGVGWTTREVEYLGGVSRDFFHNWATSRFIYVFTKIRALQLTEFDKVLLLDLDLLVRSPGPEAQCSLRALESVFELPTPAAMVRAPQVARHGRSVSYAEMWEHPTRRTGDVLPFHQQASGINAGVMLLRPDLPTLELMVKEVRDWYHPEHYATYMPEQEYLSRFYGTFDRWTHIDCGYNFEIDKNERVPHDFTQAHEDIRAKDAELRGIDSTAVSASHPGAIVLHYSGLSIKPWRLLWECREPYSNNSFPKLLVSSVGDLTPLQAEYSQKGAESKWLDGYNDRDRLWAAMHEWFAQLTEAAQSLHSRTDFDVIQAIQSRMDWDKIHGATAVFQEEH